MLVGLKHSWKCLVGYFLRDGVIHIWSVTYDETSTNFNTFKNLGCILSHNYDKIVTNFKHPTSNYQCYATLDALGDFKNIISLERKSILWDYFIYLYSLQQQWEVTLLIKLNFDQ